VLQSKEQRNAARMTDLRSCEPVLSINRFLASQWFVALVCVLTVCCSVFGVELYVYTFFIACGLYISAFGQDYLPILPMWICSYISPSLQNNPGREPDSIFYPQNGGIYLLVIFALFVVSAVIRLATDKDLGGKKFLRCKRRLMPGILALGGAYLLAGAFSGKYFDRGFYNLLFAFLQFIAIFAAYWFFTGAVKWEKARKDYFAWCGFGAGMTVLAQILHMYLTREVIVDGAIDLYRIATGWGNANNIGCMLAMMIPFAYCLARQRHRGWLFSLMGMVMAVGVLFTCSRASILGAAFAFLSSFALSLRNVESRKSDLIATCLAVICLAVVTTAFHRPILHLFRSLIDKGLNPSFRDVIYKEGWKQFTQLPIFGGTFYPSDHSIFEWSTVESFKAFFPPRWHNTVIQLLASCGIVGLGTYAFHRIQTVKLFWEKRKTDMMFVGLSVITLLLMSLLDCHMFNIGPVLVYSAALAFAEKCPSE